MQGSVFDFAMNIIDGNPQIMGNQSTREMAEVIRSRDGVRGEQIARNLCDTMGMSPEEAYSQACKFFGL